MNKEPAHFLKIFGGKLIVFMVCVQETSLFLRVPSVSSFEG